MTQQYDPEEAQKTIAINALAENYGKKFSADLLNLWLDLLMPYPVGLVEAAVKVVLERYEYKTLPPFAVLKSALDDISGVGEKALELQALAEWGVLGEAIAKNGYYNKPGLHPTTEHALRLLGGWADACQWNMKELDFKRRDFIRLWVDSHGRVEQMQLGAGGVLQALTSGTDRRSGPLHLGSALKSITAGVQQ